MSKGVNESGDVPGDGARFYVYVLRDPRDGSVFLVGRGRGTRPESVGRSIEDVASDDEDVLTRLSAIEEHGLRAEQVILARDLASDNDAATVERAVRSAYRAARITPTNLVGAAHSGGPAPSAIGRRARRVSWMPTTVVGWRSWSSTRIPR